MSDELIDSVLATLPEADQAQPEAPQKTAESPVEEAKPEEPVLDPEKLAKQVSNQNRKIGKLTAIRYQKEAENAELRSQIENLSKPAAQDDGRPKESDFTSVIDFMKADSEWVAEQKFAKFTESQTKSQTDTQQSYAELQRDQEMDRQAEEFFQSAPDAQQVIHEARPTVAGLPKAIKDIFRKADNPTLAIYNLAKDDLLDDLEDMDPIKAAMVIGAAQKSVPTKQITNAPQPMASAKGRSGARSIETMDAAELMKWAGIR